MSSVFQFLRIATLLFAVSNALPNFPQITPAPLVGLKLEAKRDSATDQNITLVGYYTTLSGAPWETNTCGQSATWSTSGQYGACAGKPSQSLYTSCSGNVLVGAAGSTTQSCGATWSVCTTLYRATDTQDADPLTYLICDVSTGLSKRSVFATTASTVSTTSTQLFSSASVSATAAFSTSGSTVVRAASSTLATSAPAPAATTTPGPRHKLVGKQIAGIVIGSIVGLGLIAAAIIVILLKRRSKAAEICGEMEDTSRRTAVELATEEKRTELPSNRERAELPGSAHVGSIKRQEVQVQAIDN